MPRGRLKGSTWSDEAKARGRARDAASRTGNLQAGTAAAIKSPISGPYETNQEAKRWWLVSPDGAEYEVVNLAKWLRDHAHLLPDERADLAYAELRQVQRWMQGKTKRRASAWKGWTLDRESSPK